MGALPPSLSVAESISGIATSDACICRRIILRLSAIVPLNCEVSAAVFVVGRVAHLGGKKKTVRAILSCNLLGDLVKVVRIFDEILFGFGFECGMLFLC